MFGKAFVINLPFKTDRLAVFQENVPKIIGDVTVWPAVHGDSVRHPEWWTAGPGAWGCYRSHMQILEHCYQNKVENYIVFEDDAIFRQDFGEQLKRFMSSLPSDWEQIYLGGQLYHEIQHPPQKVNDAVYAPYNVNRTHCFAVHRRGYEKLYRFLSQTPFANQEHIDHHLGRLHESGRFKVYCPAKWLVGQDGGSSNISGKTNSATFWIDPEKCANEARLWKHPPVVPVFLEATLDVAIELERRGWHRGKWQNAERLDRGVCDAVASIDVRTGLTQWHKAVMPEAVREGNPCVCLYHPSLTWACVSSLACATFHRITAVDAKDAELQLAAIQRTLGGAKLAEIRRRNLIYHIWPKKGNGVWQWNVSELLKRIDQFDGTRSIGIATSEDADAVEAVRASFAGIRIDNWIIAENKPDLGEVVTFSQLLNTVPHDDSVTFYGHAKGVKYDNPEETREWTSMLYEVCLDDPAFVDASLEQYPISGPFINEEHWKEITHGWHFAGSFYWFNNASVFDMSNWSDVQQCYWGSETWPGCHFSRDQAGALFGTGVGRLYDLSELERMRGWLSEWRANKRPCPPSVSIVIPTLGRQTLWRMIESLKLQLQPGDELIVVADGDESRDRCKPDVPGIRYETHVDPQSCYGNAQRNYGRSLARGTAVWFCDDDDIALPGALDAIRKAFQSGRRPTIFRIDHMGQMIWSTPEIRVGNVSGASLVIPNESRIPGFPVPTQNPHHSDNEWIRAVDSIQPVAWNSAVIYRCEQHQLGKL